MFRSPAARARLLAFLTGVAFFVIYILTQQKIPINDAYQFMDRLGRGDLKYSHLGYLPSLFAFKKIILPFYEITPLQNLTLFSALCGGGAVGAAFFIAFRFFGDLTRAAAAALLLGLTPGFWYHGTASGIYAFHAVCTAASLAALLRCLQSKILTIAEMCGVAVGVAMAPVSHLSGVAVALPAVATAMISFKISPAGWRRVWISLGASAVLFLVIYELSRSTSQAVSGYQSSIVGNFYKERLTHPETIPPYLLNAMRELLLYSAPASIFILGGFITIFRSSRAAAWMLGAWFAGYLGVCVLIGDRFYGSYYLSTFLAQVLLAISALSTIAAGSWGRAAFAAAAGLAPAIINFYFFGWGVWAAIPLVVATFFIVKSAPRPSGPTAGRASLLVPAAAALVFCSLTILPKEILKKPDWEEFGGPDLRAKGEAVLAKAPANCNFLVVEADPLTAGFWNHILNAAHPDRFFCIIFLDTLSPEFEEQYRSEAARAIETRLAKNEWIWVIGDPNGRGLSARAAAFLAQIKLNYQMEPVAPFENSPTLHRLLRK